MPTAMLVCALTAAACGLVPGPASVHSRRAMIAASAVVGYLWVTVAYLLGPRPSGPVAVLMLFSAALALVSARRWSDVQARAWVTSLGLGLLLIGLGEVLLVGAGTHLIWCSAVVAAIGSAVLVTGRRSAGTRTAAVAAAWVAWLPVLAQSPQDRWGAVLAMVSIAGAGLTVVALVRTSAAAAVLAAGCAEASLLIALGTGRAGWSPSAAPVQAYALGSLAVGVLLVGLLVRTRSIARWTAGQLIGTLAVAAAVWWLAATAWSLIGGSAAEVAAGPAGWVRLLWSP